MIVVKLKHYSVQGLTTIPVRSKLMDILITFHCGTQPARKNIKIFASFPILM